MAFAQSSNPLTEGPGRPPHKDPTSDSFGDDLPGVRDEPEQDGGVWIGITVCKTGAGNSRGETGRLTRATGQQHR
jgi:hypothetical protein